MRYLFRTVLLSTIAFTVFRPVLAQDKYLHLSVVDLSDKPIELVQLTVSVKSSTGTTNSDGKARILLTSKTPPSTEVEVRITSAPVDLVFISPWDKRVRVPSFRNASQNEVKIVLAERGIRRLLEDPRAIKAMIENYIEKSESRSVAEGLAKRWRSSALVGSIFRY